MTPCAPLVFRNGVALIDPLQLARLFLENDYSYRSYDSVPVERDSNLRAEDVRVANRIGARMSAAEIEAVLDWRAAIESALARIPADVSLTDSVEDIPWTALNDLYLAMEGIRGVGLAKATKVLHKKRPLLVPMLDSVVAAYLVSAGLVLVTGDTDATTLTRTYKLDLDSNAGTIACLEKALGLEGYSLGPCRILDLCTWAYAGLNAPPWARAAEGLVRRPSLLVDDPDEGRRLAADVGLELDDAGVTAHILGAAAREVGYARARREVARWLAPPD